MKHGKKLTYEQRKLVQKVGLDTHDWLAVKDTSTELVLVHKHLDQIKTIPKGVFT